MPVLKTYAVLVSSVAVAVRGDWIGRPVEAQSHQKITHHMFDRWMTELSNWSRWARMIKWVR